MKESLRIKKLLGLGFVLSNSIAFAAPGDILAGAEFNTPGDLEGFTDSGDRLTGFDGTGNEAVITNGDGDGVITFQIASGDPQLVLGGISIPGGILGTAEVRMRQSDNAGGWVVGPIDDDILFLGGIGSQGQPTEQIDDPAATPGSEWKLIRWDLNNITGGTATSLRVDPGNTLGAALEIDYIRVIETATPRTFEFLPETEPAPSGLGLRYSVEFDSDGDFEGVTTNANFSNATVAGGQLTGVVAGNGDAIFNIPTLELGIPTTEADGSMVIDIGMTTTAAAGQYVDLFWGDVNGGTSAARQIRVNFDTVSPPGNYIARLSSANDLIIDQELRTLRIDPSNIVGEAIAIDFVRVYSDVATVVIPTTWDPDESTAGVQGGSGTWDTVANFFNTNGVNAPWPSASTGDDDATFSAGSGVVALDAAGITANELFFETDGYDISGPGTLAFDGNEPGISVAENNTATVSAPIAETSDVRKVGAGSLNLEGIQEFSSLEIAQGEVTIPLGSSFTTTTADAGAGYSLRTFLATLNIDGMLDTNSGSLGGFTTEGPYTINLSETGNLAAGNIVVGWNQSATLNLDGTSTTAGSIRHQDSGSSVINVLGGSHTVAGFVGREANGNGDTTITVTDGELIADRITLNIGNGGNAAIPAGTNILNVNLDGGVVEVDTIELDRGPQGAASSVTTLNLAVNGGTLRALPTGSRLDLVQEDTGEAIGTETFNVTVGSSGFTVDTNGQDKRIGHAIVDGATSGGGLVKTGAGALLLTGANTYTGGTTLTAGSLGGDGSITGGLTVPAGNGLAALLEDPLAPGSGLDVGGALVLPGAMVIDVISTVTPYPEADATGIVVATGSSVSGFDAGNTTIDTSNFTGTGTFTARQEGNSIVLDYVAGDLATPLSLYLTDAGLSGDDLLATADPDGDGDSNLAEFAFGTNPNDGTSLVADFFFFEESNGDFVVSFPVRAPIDQDVPLFTGTPNKTTSIDGIVFNVQGSNDLVTFDAEITEIDPSLIPSEDINPDIDNDAYFYYSFKLETPIADAPKGFIQVEVTEEAP
jgi:autotransporter-associated beta strand protein